VEFQLQRARVRDRVEIAYVREGAGGFPLLLLHGWPETKRIWWRNVEPLAAAGFEVIVPDLAGFGDSGLAEDDHYDLAAHARDMHALVADVLGHRRCVTAGGDLGGAILYDLSLRFEGLVVRQVLFNTVPPILTEEYEAAGIGREIPREVRQAADYFMRQARDADGLAAELDTPEKRRRYVAGMYGPRFWAAPGAFTADDVEFHTEPFGDADSFRASIANYEYAGGPREVSEMPRFFERTPVPTLLLYGPEDHVIPRDFPRRMEVACAERVGPFVVEGAGHFLQWEQAELLNQAIRYFCLDLLSASSRR
jgi:pimeloyl-ACP methyl ester carboxylesterase